MSGGLVAWAVVVIGAMVGSSSSEGGVPCVRWLFQPTLVWGEVGYLVVVRASPYSQVSQKNYPLFLLACSWSCAWPTPDWTGEMEKCNNFLFPVFFLSFGALFLAFVEENHGQMLLRC